MEESKYFESQKMKIKWKSTENQLIILRLIQSMQDTSNKSKIQKKKKDTDK